MSTTTIKKDTKWVSKSGDTMTGGLNTATNIWNKIGDDVQIGDIDESGTLGIQGRNGNTAIRFTTYNQDNKRSGGKISWDGTNFNLSNPLPVNSGGSGAMTAAVTITNNYSSVLDAINAVRSTRIFPISIQKNGSALYSDMPSDSVDREWNLLLFGDKTRTTALMHIYNSSSLYLRKLFNGAWSGSWVQLH